MNDMIQQLKQERIYDVHPCHYEATGSVRNSSYESKGARQGAMSLYATMPAYGDYAFITGDVGVSEFVSDTEYYEYLREEDDE